MSRKRLDFKGMRTAVRFDDVLDVLQVKYRRRGNGQLIARCPICMSDGEAFVATPKLGLWHCFKHGKGGDAIALVAEVRQLTTTQAAQLIADTFGL